MYMTPYLSDKLRNLSALAILMVLYIHMYYTEGAMMPTLLIIEQFVGSGICSVAVPLFYVISGFLFFLNVPYGLRSISKKIKKRLRTLLIPYLLTNILTFIFYVSLNLIALKIAAIDRVVNFKVLDVILEDGFMATLKLVFINPPIAFQLWFIRDLLVVIVFSPCIWLLLNSISSRIWKILFPIALLLIFVLGGHNGYCGAFVWFTIGGFIAVSKIQVNRKSVSIVPIMLFWFCYVGLSVLWSQNAECMYLCRYIPLIGIPALWYGYDLVTNCTKNKSENIRKIVDYTFFIYLIHEPLLNIFKKLPLLLIRSEAMLIGCYILIPLFFYLFALMLGSIIKRTFPKAYSIYTGGR